MKNEENSEIIRTLQFFGKDYLVEVDEIERDNPREFLIDSSIKLHTVHRKLTCGDTYDTSMGNFIETLAWEYDIDLGEIEEKTITMQGIIDRVKAKGYYIFPLYARVHGTVRFSMSKELQNDPDTGQMGLIIVRASDYAGKDLEFIKNRIQAQLLEYNKYLRGDVLYRVSLYRNINCPTCGHITGDGFIATSSDKDSIEDCVKDLVFSSKKEVYRDICKIAFTGTVKIK